MTAKTTAAKPAAKKKAPAKSPARTKSPASPKTPASQKTPATRGPSGRKASDPAAGGAPFLDAYAALRSILEPYAKTMDVQDDTDRGYSLNSRKPYRDRTLFFASAVVMKNYVSFHLMPVYAFPELLKTASPELRKRMQGKSCFNFKEPEPALFAELKSLTKAGYDRFVKENMA
jgi:hypothetical protein